MLFRGVREVGSHPVERLAIQIAGRRQMPRSQQEARGLPGQDGAQLVGLRGNEIVQPACSLSIGLLLRVPFLGHILGRQRHLVQLGAGEDSLQRIVILLRNGIELVIVALRARHREPQKSARGGIHALVLHLGTERVEAEAGLVFERVAGFQKVARDLRLHEQVVGHVAVERLNHPVAIAEGVRVGLFLGGIELVVGVARHIQPVAAPSLAVARRGQQPVHHLWRTRRASGRREKRPLRPEWAADRSGRWWRGGAGCVCRPRAPASGPSLPVWPARNCRWHCVRTTVSLTGGTAGLRTR